MTTKTKTKKTKQARFAKILKGLKAGQRKLVDGTVVTEKKLTHISINTKCPEKWAFVDLETGEVWQHKNEHFQTATNDTVCRLRKVLKECKTCHCAVPDCEEYATRIAPISINNAEKKQLPVCEMHADAAAEDHP